MSAISSPPEPILPEPVPAPPRGLAALRKYGKILRIALVERLVYRADFFVSTIFRFLPLVTTVLLWEAVFDSSGRSRLGGYSRNEMVAYLLLVQISRMFSSMPGLAAGIARDIRDGTLKKYLLQPIDMIGYLLSYRLAHKMAYIATTALPYAILFYFCRHFFEGLPDAGTLALYFAALALSFLLGFFFETMIGMVGFWFLEVTSFLYVINTVNFFVSGHMFPLELLPPTWVAVLKALPFQYLAYFPAAVFLGMVEAPELYWGLAGQVAWIVGFIVLSRLLFRVGLARYSAYGG